MTIAVAVQPKGSLHALPLDTVWAWLVAREPLKAEEMNPEGAISRNLLALGPLIQTPSFGKTLGSAKVGLRIQKTLLLLRTAALQIHPMYK